MSTTTRMDEYAGLCFSSWFRGNKPLTCEASAVLQPPDGRVSAVAQCAVRFEGGPDDAFAVYSWLAEVLGAVSPDDLYSSVVDTDEEAQGVTIDRETGALVLVQGGHLARVRPGDWVVYIPGKGFSVMDDDIFQEVWKKLRDEDE
ncbi:hypothetical protein HMPREF1317_0112 [Schaalia georgiae F0490]|uniref:Uncharacterized protein n=1 Tax=Schaalia georgiae F0490 TaxID=1125717 RepID=J1GQP0_9ACTO|nr:hypothetical protein [Schaalia georgiae]EJF35280.1 hypothetical protein HMPREF1317_0112 [Schaalia georgiae F0490]